MFIQQQQHLYSTSSFHPIPNLHLPINTNNNQYHPNASLPPQQPHPYFLSNTTDQRQSSNNLSSHISPISPIGTIGDRYSSTYHRLSADHDLPHPINHRTNSRNNLGVSVM